MDEWREGLCSLGGPRREAMEFLRTHLMERDLAMYPFALFLEFTDHALYLRKAAPWCGELDWEIFCHYVLFPRVNDEDISFHRRIFFQSLWPRVKDLASPEDMVLEVNRWCAEIASYELTDDRTASALTVYRNGSGRCGEESVLLVSALRSVGIPARQVYVPRWSHCDDNHAWVEALCGGVWRFLGACEPEPVLDRGWFNAAASRAVLVRSRLFGDGTSPLHGERLYGEGGTVFYNQTARYAPVSERVFRAFVNGRPAAGAVFRIQILNEASFHTVAVLAADENGRARVSLGAGSVRVLASLGDLSAEGISASGELDLCLSPAPSGGEGWEDLNFHTPEAAAQTPPLSPPLRFRRAEERREYDRRRLARIASFLSLDPAYPEWDDLLLASRGNCGELLHFLRGDGAPLRERLLRTLPVKDLRDTAFSVLEDHFTRLPPRREDIPEEIYWKYVACPRVANEKLVPWRGAEPSALRVFDGGALTVVSLRQRGVPARLRPLDGAPEVWEGGSFHPVFPEKTGLLRLFCAGEPAYRLRWTVSRRTPVGWQLLDLSDIPWQGGTLTAALPAGSYRAVTSARLPGGDQLASLRDFQIVPGGELSLALRLRSFDPKDALFSQKLPPVPAVTPEGQRVPDVFRLGRPTAVVWPEEGAEPTEHLLGELAGELPALSGLGAEVVLMLRGTESLAHPSVSSLLHKYTYLRALFDDWSYDLEDIARRLTRDPDSPPLSVVCDGRGNAVYAGSGYRVGAARQLLDILTYLCGADNPKEG